MWKIISSLVAVTLLLTAFAWYSPIRSPYLKRVQGQEPFLEIDPSNLEQEGSVRDVFKRWAKAHGKMYESLKEEDTRFGHFIESWKRVLEHNSKRLSYQLGLTSFADWTDEEFNRFVASKTKLHECWTVADREAMGKRSDKERFPEDALLGQSGGLLPIPKSRDWRDEGIVSPVKNQGRCGSCWAFSAIGALEAHYKKKHNKDLLLSEQQLLDCSYGYGDFGCAGGFPARAFEYIRKSGGLETQEEYPYEMASNGSQACRFHKKDAAVRVERVVNITESDEKELEYAVAYAGPVTVAFVVSNDFRLYSSGVYTTETCGHPKPADLTHAVLAVGYGVEFDGMKYWNLKNSWGPKWGLGGYFLMERGRNLCGISDCAAYPIVA